MYRVEIYSSSFKLSLCLMNNSGYSWDSLVFIYLQTCIQGRLWLHKKSCEACCMSLGWERFGCKSTFVNKNITVEMQSLRISKPVYILNHNGTFHFDYKEIRNKEIHCGLTKKDRSDILEAFQNLESLAAILLYSQWTLITVIDSPQKEWCSQDILLIALQMGEGAAR